MTIFTETTDHIFTVKAGRVRAFSHQDIRHFDSSFVGSTQVKDKVRESGTRHVLFGVGAPGRLLRSCAGISGAEGSRCDGALPFSALRN